MPHTPAIPLLPAAAVPEISVPRYASPLIRITPVTEVISPAPAAGRTWPGHYQRILLNTRTGELSFRESTEHLEPRDPSWTAVNDIPSETWQRWHPGTLFTGTGPHQWSGPVPDLLCWVIGSGGTEFPYLDAIAANHFLTAVMPDAQALLDGLFDAAGDLDWSAAAACSGRAITQICSRDPARCSGTDADLADYQDIIRRCPQVYRPELLTLPPGDLAAACEPVTRFLGSNEHWHPEITKIFGTPSQDGTCVHLDVLGVRAWYQAAAVLAGTSPDSSQPGQVAHIVGWIQHWLDRAGLKTPRALCGATLMRCPEPRRAAVRTRQRLPCGAPGCFRPWRPAPAGTGPPANAATDT